ncbi:MAG: uroporphyrinogen-III C-methyltransferase [Betaproteobacteria bacterium]|jgi:uroporphyrin-III C-methyltransferase|nr:uroporphyrinogen-III C-methyltransferase [Betaproteobacteria bacterium]
MTGIVYFVGAGPGAPDLLTLRATRILARADVVFHDALVHPETLALATRAKLVDVGKRAGRISTAQGFINRRMVHAAQRFKIIVRLKGGDPLLFGRAQEEIEALVRAGIAYEIVPGITAALAAAAELGVSLTRRGASRTVTFATPRVGTGERAGDWASATASADTTVLYMGVGEVEEVSRCLMEQGRSGATPVAIVENASLPEARAWFGTLAELTRLAPPDLRGPATILLGEVLRERLSSAGFSGTPRARVASGRD